MMQILLKILQSPRMSPSARYHIVDYFVRVEFQHRGSPHCHLSIWLDEDPKEAVSEDMPSTVALINKLCSVDLTLLRDPEYASTQVHRHTFTSYKHSKDTPKQPTCRFNIPYWPCSGTRILLPLSSEDSRRGDLRKKAKKLKRFLEEGVFNSLDHFLDVQNLTYGAYLDCIRASIKRPSVLFKRKMSEVWINTFNPWLGRTFKSNMDLPFILDEYSCASYCVEYVNKTNRGLSDLHRRLSELQSDYPDLNFTELLDKIVPSNAGCR